MEAEKYIYSKYPKQKGYNRHFSVEQAAEMLEAYAQQYHQQEMNEFLDAVSDTPENRITLHKQIEQLKALLEEIKNIIGMLGLSDEGDFNVVQDLKERIEQLKSK